MTTIEGLHCTSAHCIQTLRRRLKRGFLWDVVKTAVLRFCLFYCKCVCNSAQPSWIDSAAAAHTSTSDGEPATWQSHLSATSIAGFMQNHRWYSPHTYAAGLSDIGSLCPSIRLSTQKSGYMYLAIYTVKRLLNPTVTLKSKKKSMCVYLIVTKVNYILRISSSFLFTTVRSKVQGSHL